MRHLGNENAGIRIVPAPLPHQIQYYNVLSQREDWLQYIADYCQGPTLPPLPAWPTLPLICTQTNPPMYDKFCDCCKGRWSIVIAHNAAVGNIEAALMLITDIQRNANVYVQGYIYPDLTNIKTLPAYVIHIGCM